MANDFIPFHQPLFHQRQNGGRHGGRGRSGRGRGRGRGGRGRGRGRGRQYSNNNNHNNESSGSHHGHIVIDDTKQQGNDTQAGEKRVLRIAVEGCAHGEIETIYNTLQNYEKENPSSGKIDLLLCCGDFQSIRNKSDLKSLSVPDKYKSMGSFYKYYSGELKAPILTIFIGGNHENSKQLTELQFGGWVAPNIYFLGHAGVVNFGGLRIGGISGIYKSHDFFYNRFERPPFNSSELRSVYHVRRSSVFQLKQFKAPIDIFMSHDWPQGIEQHGNTKALLRQKKFFAQEVAQNTLGSPPNRELMDHLKPKRWFSAHLHVQFEARLLHNSSQENNDQEEEKQQTDFIGLESDCVCPSANDPRFDLTAQMTKFLALDKCLPRRKHLQIVQIPSPTLTDSNEKIELEYDLEWLSILKFTYPHLYSKHNSSRNKVKMKLPNQHVSIPESYKQELLQQIVQHRQQNSGEEQNALKIPHNFHITIPPHDRSNPELHSNPRFFHQTNQSWWWNNGELIGDPQTDSFLEMLGLQHTITVPYNIKNRNKVEDIEQINANTGSINLEKDDENEIDLDCDEDDDDKDDEKQSASVPVSSEKEQIEKPTEEKDDENEIELDDEEEDEIDDEDEKVAYKKQKT